MPSLISQLLLISQNNWNLLETTLLVYFTAHIIDFILPLHPTAPTHKWQSRLSLSLPCLTNDKLFWDCAVYLFFSLLWTLPDALEALSFISTIKTSQWTTPWRRHILSLYTNDEEPHKSLLTQLYLSPSRRPEEFWKTKLFMSSANISDTAEYNFLVRGFWFFFLFVCFFLVRTNSSCWIKTYGITVLNSGPALDSSKTRLKIWEKSSTPTKSNLFYPLRNQDYWGDITKTQ